MSIFPQLEQDLREAAERELVRERRRSHSWPSRAMMSWRASGTLRRLRLLFAAIAGVFAMTTIALAASGAFPVGSSAPESGPHAPRAGVGLPAKGGTRLLSIRAADPKGGLPWGLRLVDTTRGELCIQLGRVEDGKLGELGIDGAFSNDGRFHPVGAANLPSLRQASPVPQTESTTCGLAGAAAELEDPALDRNAASRWIGPPHSTHPPLDHLRDVLYGVLGPDAVSVTYRYEGKERTVRVERGTGAYLIVLRAASSRLLHGGSGWIRSRAAAPSSYGNIIRKNTYEVKGATCEVGAYYGRDKELPVAHRCVTPQHSYEPPMPPRKLHRHLAAKLLVRKHLIVAASISFKAPFAVTSAASGYSIAIESCGRHREGLEQIRAIEPVARDVDRDSRIALIWSHPFVECDAKSITFEALYEHEGERRSTTIVGHTTLVQPPRTLLHRK